MSNCNPRQIPKKGFLESINSNIDYDNVDPALIDELYERALEKAHLTTNKNTVPGETRSPFKTSGIRLGTPAVTTRGMQEIEMRIIAKAIHRVLTNSEDENVISEVRDDVISLCDKFPLPY